MTYRYGSKSRTQLDTCDPRLRTIFNKLIEFIDVSILEGRRTFAQQLRNIGKKVSKTINSRHIPRKDDGAIDTTGLSKAVDAAPYPIRWPDRSRDREKQIARFYYMQGAIRAIAHYEDIPIRQGVDWDGDGDFFDQTFDDLPHTEIDEPLPALELTPQQQRRVDIAFDIARLRV